MRLEDDQIIAAYNSAVQLQHPDPLGFIARADILSKLDPDKKTSGFIGPFAVNSRKLKEVELTRSDITDLDANLNAAIQQDLLHYEQADQDIEEMYRLSLSRGSAKFKSFKRNLDKKKKELEKEFQVSDTGSLTALSPPEPRIKEKSTGTAVTTRSVNRVPTTDEITTLPIATLSLAEIEPRFDDLIEALLNE